MTVSELISELIELSQNGYSKAEVVFGTNAVEDESCMEVFVSEDEEDTVVLD